MKLEDLKSRQMEPIHSKPFENELTSWDIAIQNGQNTVRSHILPLPLCYQDIHPGCDPKHRSVEAEIFTLTNAAGPARWMYWWISSLLLSHSRQQMSCFILKTIFKRVLKWSENFSPGTGYHQYPLQLSNVLAPHPKASCSTIHLFLKEQDNSPMPLLDLCFSNISATPVWADKIPGFFNHLLAEIKLLSMFLSKLQSCKIPPKYLSSAAMLLHAINTKLICAMCGLMLGNAEGCAS